MGPEGGPEDAIRVLVADDEPDILEYLKLILAAEPDLELAGAASDTDELLRLAAEVQADVAVVDWMMPGGGGARAARELGERGVRVIGFTAGDPMQASYDMLGAGAVGFLEKGAPKAEIVAAIRSVRRF